MLLQKNKDIKKEDKKAMLAILSRLNEGIKVQESSAEIMTFLVQDLLDYA